MSRSVFCTAGGSLGVAPPVTAWLVALAQEFDLWWLVFSGFALFALVAGDKGDGFVLSYGSPNVPKVEETGADGVMDVWGGSGCCTGFFGANQVVIGGGGG
jgi:hypothetical protein